MGDSPTEGTLPRVAVSSGTPLLALGVEAALRLAGIDVSHVARGPATIWGEGDANVRVLAEAHVSAETVARLAADGCRLPLLVLTRNTAPPSEARLVRAGASAVLPLASESPAVVSAVRDLAAGRPRVSVAAIRLLAQTSDAERFTLRQREILRLLSSGHDGAEIARRLGIAPSTVKTHVARLEARLGVDTRQDLAAAAEFMFSGPVS